MEDWGEIELMKVDSDGFWFLMDELYDDNHSFIYNRTTILEAYKNGNLYGLLVSETHAMYERDARNDRIFCKNSWYMLPCFCVKQEDTAILIWTHARARRMGFAKKLVELLHIKYAYHPQKDSLGFWKKCGINLALEMLHP
jgi:hypothetical protein